jgi:hypothetical protein
LPIMTTSPFVDEINYRFFHSNIRYISAIIVTQIAITNNAKNNLGNIINITINIANIKNIQIAFANVMGLIPQLSSLPHKFSINVFI